ncbi:hypothetical protein [Streptomyces himastatinicus]|uniref:hypothetical protein n=1 Tax=Streptomyces himastatinicus TaxID=998084 RepID=UPI0001B5207C|nr:hypothetical protein [Streptomyces himastatinicus]
MNEEEIARAVEEGMRRNDVRRAAAWRKARDQEARNLLKGLGCMALVFIVFIVLMVKNPGG